METRFNWFSDAWVRLKNHCRTTVSKEVTDNEPSDEFKKKILISEHSPIRLLEFDWTWKMPYWVHAEWARHKFEKFISSQRDDRNKNDIPRGKKPQDSPVTFDGFANMQNLIDAWRKRLCYMATKDARKYAEDFKAELKKQGGDHVYESDVLVPNCIYRYGCPEFKSCGFWDRFVLWCLKHQMNVGTIQDRYDAYNKFFYERRKEGVK